MPLNSYSDYMNRSLILLALFVILGFSQTAESRDYDFDSYNEGYERGYDNSDSIDYERMKTDPAYEDGVMEGEDQADREHVEQGGTLNYPHPDSY